MAFVAPALTRRCAFAATFAAVFLCGVHTAFAIDDSSKSVARQLSAEGKTAYDEGRYQAAADSLGRAYEATKVPTIGLWYARALVKLSRWVEASELFREIVRLTPNELWLGSVQQGAQGEAQQELDTLLPRLPSLTLVVEGADAAHVALSVDGSIVPSSLRDLARPANPGTHQVTATLGKTKVERSVTLAEGEKAKVVLPFDRAVTEAVPATSQPSSAAAPSATVNLTEPTAHSTTQPTLGWVTLGVGVAGLATGAVAGILMVSRYRDVDDDCDSNGHCDKTVSQSNIDSFNRLRTLSMAGFIGGGVLAAAGVTLVLTSPSSSGPELQARVTGNYVGLSGAF